MAEVVEPKEEKLTLGTVYSVHLTVHLCFTNKYTLI